MLSPRFLLLGVSALMMAYEAHAFECSIGGVYISCPTVISNSNDVFCCASGVTSLNYCCSAEEFLKQNSAVLAGIVIGAIVLLLIMVLCCCCCCSCCLLARRRTARGTVYGPIGESRFPPSTYPVMHAPPPPSQYFNPPPPPYQPPTAMNMNYVQQPPLNPNYK